MELKCLRDNKWRRKSFLIHKNMFTCVVSGGCFFNNVNVCLNMGAKPIMISA